MPLLPDDAPSVSPARTNGSASQVRFLTVLLYRPQLKGDILLYIQPNLKTKKALKDALAKGEKISVFSPGPFPCPNEGRVTIEGPHYPEAHKWYAQVVVKDGYVVKVLS